MRDSSSNRKKTCWFFYLVCFSSLYNFSNPIFRVCGGLTILAFILIFYIVFFRKIRFKRKDGMMVIGLFLLLSTAVAKNVTFYALRSYVLSTVSITCLYYFSRFDLDRINFKNIRIIMTMQSIILLLPLLLGMGNDELGAYQSFFSTTTFLGDYSALMIEISVLCFVYTKRNKAMWYTLIGIYLLLVILSRTRTALLGILVIVGFAELYRYLKKCNEKTFQTMSFLWIALIIISVVTYVFFDKLPYSQEIQNVVFKYTHKPLLSGREIIWRDAIIESKDSFWLGLGYDYRAKIMNASVHNSYIDIYMFGGLITLIWFIIFLITELNKNKPNLSKSKYYLFVCTLANLLTAAAEVMLVRGQSCLQIIMWAIIGLGINYSNSSKYVCYSKWD